MTIELAAGTLLTLELHRHWWDHRPRWTVLAGLERRLRLIESRTQRRTVVAAAIIAGSKVLLAQRSNPPALAGQWEFPGGKLERGETGRAALIRECAEELGCTVLPGAELDRQCLDDGAVLVLFQAALAPGSAPPTALAHQQVRWVDAADLAALDLVETNRRYLSDLLPRLSNGRAGAQGPHRND